MEHISKLETLLYPDHDATPYRTNCS